MSELIHIGYGNAVNADKIIAIVHPEAAPVKRLITHARDHGNAVDATHGRKTQAVIVMEGQQVVLSALTPETIVGRTKGAKTNTSAASEDNEGGENG